MPSPRRMRLLMLATFSVVVMLFLYSSSESKTRESEARSLQDFYHKTVKAMDSSGKSSSGDTGPGQAVLNAQTGDKAGHIPADKDADGDVDEDDERVAAKMQELLKAAEQEAKDKANEKAGMKPDSPSDVIGVGSSADGQKKKLGEDAAAAAAVKDSVVKERPAMAIEAAAELKTILTRAPVVIFSKTYCPFSKRAKGLLLEKYAITPAPYVVELDDHALGSYLQDELQEATGRRTVPNILINGVSIGGADDIVALDNDDKLVAKIKYLGESKISVTERFVSGP